MAEKLVPATKPVPRADGMKNGSANKTTTTPNHTDAKYWNREKENKDKMF